MYEIARAAGFATIGVSSLGLFFNFLAVPMLLSSISNMNVDVERSAALFRLESDAAWKNMMTVKHMSEESIRVARQAQYGGGQGSTGGLLRVWIVTKSIDFTVVTGTTTQTRQSCPAGPPGKHINAQPQ